MVAKRIPAAKGVPHRQTLRSLSSVVDPTEQAALRYLARRDRTEAQMRAYLTRLGVSSAHVGSVIKRLVEQGYLDDERYALRWASARLARHPMGRERLEAELIGQGLDRDKTERALEQAYGGRSERDLALALLRRKYDVRNPVSRSGGSSLLRRYGFTEETIEAVLRNGES
ncbi:MAG: regulatory protein RecX [Nitrospiraceae bacterium]